MNAFVNTSYGDWSLNSSKDVNHNEVPPFNERPEFYYVPILFAIIFAIGVVGNGTLVFIFVRHRNMRSVPNTYILSLALGDLLVIVSCVPFTSTIYTWPNWPFGEIVCKISETSKDVSVGVSVFTLTALSADRFFAIVDPIRKQFSSVGGRGATKVTVCIAMTIWGLAFILSLPALLNSYVRVESGPDDSTVAFCYPFPKKYGEDYAKVMIAVKFLLYYAIPLTIIGFFYVMMARHLILSTRNVPGELQPHPQARQIRARKKVAKTVLAFVIIFAVCFLPTNVFLLWFYFDPNSQADYNSFWHILRIAGFCLAYANSCINPIALYCVSGTFRKHFDRYLFCFCRLGLGADRRRPPDLRRCTGTPKWDSTSLLQLRPPGNLHHHQQLADCTVTTCMNGA